MENASKALLIAGSILIVILLIAMGVRIFSSTEGTADAVEGTVQTAEITMFNNKFMTYLGYDKTKNDIINLLNVIIANNATSNRTVDIKVNASLTNNNRGTSLRGWVNVFLRNMDSSKKAYIYVLNYEDGYIKEIQIENNRR